MKLDDKESAGLQIYLAGRGRLAENEGIVLLSKPGDGNMNYTLRVQTATRSFIVKQALGYVEKYPSIPAPAERAIVEGLFYRQIAPIAQLRTRMPALLDLDEANNLLILEDLGTAADFTSCYQKEQSISTEELTTLTTYLSVLHAQPRPAHPNPALTNRAMRALNHEHIFQYPFRNDTGFDLDTVQPGLQALATQYRHPALAAAALQLGEQYLSDQTDAPTTLLHGDFYPGSWLRTAEGVKVIDPEFCFYGPAEFDLGVMLAHLQLAQQPPWTTAQVLAEYIRPAAGFNEINLRQFTGIEILRRLIGLAQLPLSLTLDQKETLLQQATALVLD